MMCVARHRADARLRPGNYEVIVMETHGVVVREVRVLRGPNLYAFMPVLQVTLDIGPYEDRPSNSFPGFVERITAWLPGLETHECSVGRPGGFIERLRRGTYLAHIAEHVALELQNMMGFEVSFGRARGTEEHGVYRVVVAYKEEVPGRAAFNTALRLTLAAMHDEPFEIAAELEALMALADEYRLGPSTAAIVAAARKRRIPVIRIKPTGSLVQLGYGVHQQRIWASETSGTSAIAVDLCQEKPLTNHMLRVVGVPVPDGDTVTSEDDAWRAARTVGLPVVVKPLAGNQGKGVSSNLTTEQDVRSAFAIARRFSPEVLVEQFIEGHDYRLLVVNGRMVAAARRDPALVTGDGRRTVRELVEETNRDPRRRDGHSSILTRIRLDDAVELVLQQQGMTLDSVPELGHKVKLRENCNLSTGGTATDVTDLVHPRNVRMAELAAQILRLDVAGVDMLCRDISRPLREQNGAIVEVNASPGLRMHIHPAEGQSRDVGTPIIKMLYPDNKPARIPIIAVTGTNGKTTVTRLIAHMYETARKVVGMTCTEGTYIDQERIMRGDCSGPRSALAVLLHPYVEVAVLETARGGILREGLAFDACTVGVVTNVTSDHLGLRGIHTVEDLAKVKQVVVENVRPDGAAVLNADDPLVAQMAAATDGRVIYFAASPTNPIVIAHRESGGQAVFVRDGGLIMATGAEEMELLALERIGFTLGGRIQFQVQNALAAVAAAWGAGLNPAMIARALTTFATDGVTVPGRFNVTEVGGVQIVVDYGHNPAAMQALGQAMDAFGPRRTVMLLGLPGDRRDEDLTATIQATQSYVDEYVLFELDDRRGRGAYETTQLLRRSISDDVPCAIAQNQRDGVERAWQRVHPGERLMLIVDEVDEGLEQVTNLASATAQDAVCIAPINAEPVHP
jgi:cyanophycin synthetase